MKLSELYLGQRVKLDMPDHPFDGMECTISGINRADETIEVLVDGVPYDMELYQLEAV